MAKRTTRRLVRVAVDKHAEGESFSKELEKLGELARQKFGDQITGAVGSEVREPGRLGLDNNPRVKHLAKGKKITIKNKFHPKYSGGGENALIDGIKGTSNFNDGSWQGFEYKSLEAVIDLEKNIKVSEISTGFLEQQGNWIFTPQKVEYFISKDGENFQKIFNKVISITDREEEKTWNITAKIEKQKVRYIKVIAENIHDCPEWHIGKGGRAWLFVDEIEVR